MLHHPNRAPRRIALVPIVALLGTVLLLAPVASAQSDPKVEKKPEQKHISELEKPFVHEEEPAFAFQIPDKRSVQELKERWRIVDLAARRAEAMKVTEDAIAQEKAKEEPNQDLLYKLDAQKARIIQYYDSTRLLLEVDGDAEEYVRVTVQPYEGKVAVDEINPKAGLEKRWSNVKVLQDEDTTTKGMRSAGRVSHRLMLFGTPEGSDTQGYYRIETYVIPPSKGGTPFLLQYVHRMDAQGFDKKSAKNDEILFRCFRVA